MPDLTINNRRKKGQEKKNVTFAQSKIKIFVRFIFGLLILVVLAIASYSCKERGGKNISQGEIHYTIEYVGKFGPLPEEFRPKNLIVSFKKDKILYEMLSPIGNSGVMNLANPGKDIYDTYISLFTIRYFYDSERDEVQPGFEAMAGMEINKTSKTAVICGFNCKNAEITFPQDRNKRFSIWYTDEIDIKNPNITNPYQEIDGVLMSFLFIMGGSELHFTAETVYKKEISDRMFERREKFKRVSKEDINKFIIKMINL